MFSSEQVLGVAEKAVEKFDTVASKNIDLIVDYVKEETYRVSSLLISLNIGVLSAASFVFSSVELTPIAKVFVPLLMCSLLSISLEIFIRKNTLAILRVGSAHKVQHADRYRMKLSSALVEHASDLDQCLHKTQEIMGSFDKENIQTNNNIDKEIKPYLLYRRYSEVLIVCSILGLLLVALSQLGIVNEILHFYEVSTII